MIRFFWESVSIVQSNIGFVLIIAFLQILDKTDELGAIGAILSGSIIYPYFLALLMNNMRPDPEFSFKKFFKQHFLKFAISSGLITIPAVSLFFLLKNTGIDKNLMMSLAGTLTAILMIYVFPLFFITCKYLESIYAGIKIFFLNFRFTLPLTFLVTIFTFLHMMLVHPYIKELEKEYIYLVFISFPYNFFSVFLLSVFFTAASKALLDEILPKYEGSIT